MRLKLDIILGALAPTNYREWCRVIQKRYLGIVKHEEYGQIHDFTAYTGRRCRSREPVVFLARRVKKGHLRTVFLTGRYARGLIQQVKARRP